jgi:negative regulator of genetic competence, sporulation and motility
MHSLPEELEVLPVAYVFKAVLDEPMNLLWRPSDFADEGILSLEVHQLRVSIAVIVVAKDSVAPDCPMPHFACPVFEP